MSTLKVSTISPLGTDATKTITIGSAGDTIAGEATNTPAFYAECTTDFSLGDNTSTLVKWQTTIFDTDTGYDSSTGRYTIPTGKGGKYVFFVGALINSQADQNMANAVIYLKKNGTTVNSNLNYYNSTRIHYKTFNTIHYEDCNAGDYIEAYCLCDAQNGGGTSVLGNASAGYSHFGGYKLIGV
jgi:hypothetical protein|tara:strand:- start:837 stop:1388 length:552 start_codon:yes stop_codon:yes gene_type:complete